MLHLALPYILRPEARSEYKKSLLLPTARCFHPELGLVGSSVSQEQQQKRPYHCHDAFLPVTHGNRIMWFY